MRRHISAHRPVEFDGKDGINFAYSVGSSIKDLLHKSDGERGVILILVDTHVIVPGVESHEVDIAFVPGDLIFDDCPFEEPEQVAIRNCMAECKPDEYVLIAVISTKGADGGHEAVHICVASRNLEKGRVAVYDPRNN